MTDLIVLQKCSRTCMGLREVDGHDKTIPCASAVSAPNCFCERHSNQRGMLTATSVVAFNDIVRDIKQLPLSSMDSINRIDAAIDALQEDIKEHLKAALSSIGDRIQSLKKRKEPSAVTQAEARRAIRDLARLKRCSRHTQQHTRFPTRHHSLDSAMYKCRLVTGVDGGHPRDALAILGVVPSEDNDPTASICPVCMERRATRVVLGSCGHAVCAKCVISNPVAKCPVCRGSISFVLRVF